jgi:HlyD family secretion protein
MHSKAKIVFPIALLLIIAASAYFFVQNRNGNGDKILLSGNIEIEDSVLSFQVTGVLAERSFDEGDTVEKGDVVARLDTVEYEQQTGLRSAELAAAEAALAELEAGTRPEKLTQAAAQVGQAAARLAELRSGARSQELSEAENAVTLAETDVQKAEADLALKKLDLDRARTLFEQGVTPEQQLDSAKTLYEVALQTRDAARARVDSARERLSLIQEGASTEQIAQAKSALDFANAAYSEAKNGPRAETIAQARAKVAMARSTLEMAETKLSQAELIAPFGGVVLSKSLEPGEYVRPGATVVTIGDLEHVFLRAFVNETDLGKIKLGQKVDVTTDSYPGRVYEGTIVFISSESEFTPKTIQTKEERVRLVYRVKIAVVNASLELKPGMPADAVIHLKES